MTTAEFNICVEEHADGLYRFLLKNIRNEAIASDLVQDSFEKMWVKSKEIDFQKGKSYLFTTGYRTMIDHIRRSKKQSEWTDGVVKHLHHSSNYSDLNEVLSEALDRLPADQKSVVLLRDYEGYSYKEIAEITGLNESQVKVYIFRARVALKDYLVKIEYVI